MKGLIKYIKIFSFLLAIPCFSQINMVPNSSFEDTIACPNNIGQIDYALFWTNPTTASPDYMNACNDNDFGVPSNYLGNQKAHTGKAYALIAVYCFSPSSISYREYIQVYLKANLLRGELYCVEFYVCLANGKYSEYAVNNLGAYFSSSNVSSMNRDPLPYSPQIVNPKTNSLTHTGEWIKISGQFTAKGNEKYLIIGNFNDNESSDTVFVKHTAVSMKESDYYIDDVSVIHLNADAGKDTAICLGDSLRLGRVASTGLTYAWQPSTGLSNPTIAQPIATPAVTTTYYLTATLQGGCAKQDTVTVTVVNANAGRDTVLCEGSTIRLGAEAVTGVTYSWQPIHHLSNSSIAQPTAAPTSTITYTLTAKAAGCIKKDTVHVKMLPVQQPPANAGASKKICLGDTIQLGSESTSGYKYVWSTQSNLSNPYSAQPFAFPKKTTVYKLTVTDTVSNYVCKATGSDSVMITVDDCLPILPTVFTPNGDGINDEFVITNVPLGSSVTIYDRWGIEIANYKLGDVSWNGKSSEGNNCVEGIYFYTVSSTDGKVEKGFLQLLR